MTVVQLQAELAQHQAGGVLPPEAFDQLPGNPGELEALRGPLTTMQLKAMSVAELQLRLAALTVAPEDTQCTCELV